MCQPGSLSNSAGSDPLLWDRHARSLRSVVPWGSAAPALQCRRPCLRHAALAVVRRVLLASAGALPANPLPRLARCSAPVLPSLLTHTVLFPCLFPFPSRWRRVEMTAPLLREDFGTGDAAALAPAGVPTRSPSPPAGAFHRQLAATGSGGSSRLQPTPEEGEADEQLQEQEGGGGGGGVPGWAGEAGAMPAGSPGAGRGPLPLGLAGSLPHDLESAVGAAAAAADAGGSTQHDRGRLPLGASGAPPFASLPDLHAETRRQQQQHQQHLR